jgi:uncharacterized protein YggU (UPF0235/DUF167 family)
VPPDHPSTTQHPVRPHPEGSALAVRVVPGASSTTLAGTTGNALRIRVAAPAIEGNANAALLAFLAHRLGLRPRALRLATGEHSREKLVIVPGRTPEEVRAALGVDPGR